MAEKRYTVDFGEKVTVIPAKAAEKIINGDASLADTRVLLAFIELYQKGEADVNTVAYLSRLTVSKVENSIAFWRGSGVISESEVVSDEDSDSEGNAEQPKEKKALKTAEMPKYTGEEISKSLEKDGGRMKVMIDECQQLIGHIFNPSEISAMVGMCDWLGLQPEFIITVTAYYTSKKPGCSVRYIERAATDLVNGGITTLEELDRYLKEMELYDGVAGKIRSWLGIGAREYTKKENGMIKRWVRDYSYGEDIIRFAYEITVDAKGSFSFDYANKILENWYTKGVRSFDDAQNAINDFKAEKEKKATSGGSFDTDEFFGLALKRSYKNMKNSGESK